MSAPRIPRSRGSRSAGPGGDAKPGGGAFVARGVNTTEIAEELFLSAHTVRDHIEALFGKTKVSSRGELVAKLFAEFYEPVHMAQGTLRIDNG